MADIHDCIERAAGAGMLDRTRANGLKSEYDQLVARYESYLPRAQADVAAAEALKEATRATTVARRHKVIAQMQAAVRLKALLDAAPDPAVALRNLLEYSEGSGFTGESIRSLQDAMIKSVNAGIRDTLKATGRTLLGNSRDRAMLRNIIRELHGEATGDVAARDLAEAVRRQQERLRLLFNAHGGNIGKLSDYGVSHAHNVMKIRRAGPEAWAEAILPRLAWDRIVNHKTGQPFAAKGQVPAMADVEVFLRDVWDGITSRGWDDRDPSMSVGGKALYNQRADHRVLHFKTGDDWMDYNAEFGMADPFTAMVGGLHGMARDIAQMRVLGPNPRMGLEFATQIATQKANLLRDAALESRVRSAGKLAKTMLAHADGSVNMPVNAFWASFFGGVRQVLTGIQLGSAPLSAVTDLKTMRMAAKVAGMKPNHLLARATKLAASPEARAIAARAGYIADSLADMGSAAARYTGDTFAPELTERVSSFTMRASGLQFWTDMLRIAFPMEFGATLASQADKPFDQILPELRRMFEARGITPADWDALRAPGARFTPKPDVDFITPFHFLEHTSLPRAEAEGLALRLQMLIEEQMEFAVPTSSLEGRARMLGTTQPGTFEGELLRSTTMYKGFTLSFTLNQVRRFNALPTGMDKARYALSMASGLIALGAVAVQLKEMAKGRDPRPMDEGKFWMAALFQSGGLGIFGDFFASETSRAGGGLAETIAGPVVGAASDVIGPVAGNIAKLISGEDTTVGRDVSNFVRYNTPVASSLWYSRIAFDRLVADQLQRLLDADAAQAWRRQERQRERDYGTRTWWERGELTPTRAPDPTNMAGRS